MKNVKILLTTIAVLAAIGCSRNNPVGLNDSTPGTPVTAKSSDMTISFNVLPVPVTQAAMKKTTALVNYSPAYAIIQNFDAPVSRDSVALTAGQTTASLTKTLTQNTAYNFYVYVYSAAGNSSTQIINIGSASGTVPKTTTCEIAITCPSTATNFVANITLGPISSAKAINATLSWKQINVPGGGQPVTGSASITFPAGTTTASVNGLVYLAQAPDPTQFLMYLNIGCNEGGVYENNVTSGVSAGDAITLSPSTNASLTFSTFTEVGGPNTSSLAKADITVNVEATATGTAVLPKKKI